jgi:hypothetical protein
MLWLGTKRHQGPACGPPFSATAKIRELARERSRETTQSMTQQIHAYGSRQRMQGEFCPWCPHGSAVGEDRERGACLHCTGRTYVQEIGARWIPSNSQP